MATVYMGMTLPVVGPSGTAGTTYATYLVTALETIDAHDHSTGKGTKITPAGMNMNAALDMNEYALTDVARLGLFTTSSTLTSVNSVYVKSGQLYFVDSAGNQVQLTSGGGINLSSVGSIGGDFSTSTAAVTYSNVSKAFTFTQTAGITADIAAGSLFIYENLASAKYTKIKNTASQASNQTITLPAAMPASTKIMTMTSGGVIGVAYDADGTNLEVSADAIRIKDLGVTTAKLADGAVTQAKRAARTAGTGAGQISISSSSGTFSSTSATYVDVTNLSVSLTTLGGAVKLMLQSDGAAATAELDSGGIARVAFLRGATQLSEEFVGSTMGPNGVSFVDIPSAGTYTYKVQVKTNSTVYASNMKLVAYEL